MLARILNLAFCKPLVSLPCAQQILGGVLILVLLGGCREPGELSFPVPPQLSPAEALPSKPLLSRLVLDDLESHAQVVDGFHPQHPGWLDGRWMLSEARVLLGFDPAIHRRLVVRGLYEGYQLQQTGPVRFTVVTDGVSVLDATIAEAGNFTLQAPLPASWRPATAEAVLHLSASPSWQMEGWPDRFTLTIIDIGLEGAE